MLTVAIIVLVYFGLLVGLSIAVRPYRNKLEQGVQNLIDHQNLTDREREFLNHLRASIFSVRIAPMFCLVFLTGMVSSADGIIAETRDDERLFPNLQDIDQMGKLIDYHMACGAAANPIFGAIAYVLSYAFDAKLRWVLRRYQQSSVEVEQAMSRLAMARI